MWFLYHFFSIPILTKTFFSKFERLGEGYKKAVYLKHNLATFIINTLMRLLGVIVRSVVITVGCISLIIMTCVGVVSLVLWLLFPLGVFLAIVVGLVKLL